MKDNLEKFFEEHKDEFDPYMPPDRIWQSLDKKLKRKQSRIHRAYYPLAASVLLIIGAFAWFIQQPRQKNKITGNTGTTLAPEIKEAEVYYASVMETKRAELKQFGNDYPDLFKDFNGEMDTLHVLFSQLETEYKNSDGNEAVLQALVGNLQMQVQLLNKQIQIIQDIKQHENKQSKNSRLM